MRSVIPGNFIICAGILVVIAILCVVTAVIAAGVRRSGRERRDMLERLNGSVEDLHGTVRSLSGSVDEIRDSVTRIQGAEENGGSRAPKVVVMIDDRVQTQEGQRVLLRASDPARAAKTRPDTPESAAGARKEPDGASGKTEPEGPASPTGERNPELQEGAAPRSADTPRKGAAERTAMPAGLAGLAALIPDPASEESGEAAAKPAPPKFMDRSCGTDKNGRTYTEEELRKLIR